jgi:hypothetical protein
MSDHPYQETHPQETNDDNFEPNEAMKSISSHRYNNLTEWHKQHRDIVGTETYSSSAYCDYKMS